MQASRLWSVRREVVLTAAGRRRSRAVRRGDATGRRSTAQPPAQPPDAAAPSSPPGDGTCTVQGSVRSVDTVAVTAPKVPCSISRAALASHGHSPAQCATSTMAGFAESATKSATTWCRRSEVRYPSAPDAAAASGADVYLTSDLRHHVVADFVADSANPAIVEVAHWAGEWPWLANAALLIEQGTFGAVTATVSTLRTDPWTVHVPSPGGDDGAAASGG